MSQRRWVFLTHTLEQVGPPVFLLEFLRWIRRHTDTEVAVVSLADGSLHPAFSALGPVVVLGEPDPVLAHRPGEQLATAARDRLWRARVRQFDDPGLVYVNTAKSIRLRRYLPSSTAPLVTHAHELEVGLDFHLPAPDRAEVLEATDHWVAASGAVADNLVRTHGVDRDSIAVHHEMIAIDDGPQPAADPSLRRLLGIPADAPVIGTAAIVDWRKAPDLFLELAWRLAHGPHRDLGIHSIWIGGKAGERDVIRFRDDLAAAGLTDTVHHRPAVDQPLDWMRAFDLFVLPAREDAFPLACLEAASTGRPIVCFDSGGMAEFVEDDCGVVLPYPDVRAMADVVADLVTDGARRAALGAQAAAKVRARHEVSVAAPRLYADLARWARP